MSSGLDKKTNFKLDEHVYFVHEYGLDFHSNEIFLVGALDYATINEEMEEPGVEHIMATRFIKNLSLLISKSTDPILIHSKTCGGDWQEGIAIYDAIKTCPNYITVLNYTHARSMSSLTFLACDKKIMMPNSLFMLHNGTFATAGTVQLARSEFEQMEKDNDVMLNIYVDVLKNAEKGSMRNKSEKQIKAWLTARIEKKEDVWFSAQEAVDLGFADEIFDGNWNKLSDTKPKFETE